MVELVDTIDLESILLVYTEIVRGSSPLSLNEEFKVKFKFFKTRLFYKKFMNFL